jgi:hypothetical protein
MSAELLPLLLLLRLLALLLLLHLRPSSRSQDDNSSDVWSSKAALRDDDDSDSSERNSVTNGGDMEGVLDLTAWLLLVNTEEVGRIGDAEACTERMEKRDGLDVPLRSGVVARSCSESLSVLREADNRLMEGGGGSSGGVGRVGRG